MSLNEDALPPYEYTPPAVHLEEIQIAAETGIVLLDATRLIAQALVVKAKAMQHHKSACRALADRADSIIFGVVVSTLYRRIVSQSVLKKVKELQSAIQAVDALFDEIQATGPAMRNMNRSWTERRLSLLSTKLISIAKALHIRNGRCGLIEALVPSPPSPAPSRLSTSSNPWSALSYYPWMDATQLGWRPSLAEVER